MPCLVANAAARCGSRAAIAATSTSVFVLRGFTNAGRHDLGRAEHTHAQRTHRTPTGKTPP
jgi:hypothetical protein